jgi:hypothetical protein
MNERSELNVTVRSSPRSGELLIGARLAPPRRIVLENWNVHR